MTKFTWRTRIRLWWSALRSEFVSSQWLTESRIGRRWDV